MTRFWLRILPFVLLACLAPLGAQVNTGSIGGSVLDPGGAAIPGATVVASEPASGQVFETRSSDAGVYVFPSLPTGVYEITVEQSGFKKLTQPGLEVRVAQRLALDLTLSIADVTESVEVSAALPLASASRRPTCSRPSACRTVRSPAASRTTRPITSPKR